MRTYIPDSYKIGKHRYIELFNFCLQYDDFLRRSEAEQIKIIEESLSDAEPNEAVREFLRKAIRWGLSYEKLGAVPVGRRQFYEIRRKFFYILSQKRG